MLGQIDKLEFKSVVRKGVQARRSVVPLGFDYAYDFRDVNRIGELPEWLHPLRQRAASAAALAGEKFDQALISKYPAGAGIGWHSDAPKFDSTVLAVSLAGSGVMRFRRTANGATEQFVLDVAPRSMYIMTGEARWQWQHSLNPTNELRYSITMRMVRHDYQSRSRSVDA